MRNLVTFIRFSNIKELKKIEKRLIEKAQIYGYEIVHAIQVDSTDYDYSTSVKLFESLSDLHQKKIKVSAIMVERYDHLHTDFLETAELIKKISPLGVRIISIQETVDENDILFTAIYHSIKFRES
jgi:DNA invertase Pin-like site-specific DNA recombinase